MDGNGGKIATPPAAVFFERVRSWLNSMSLPLSICVAYSGGRDSHALLHALWRLRGQHVDLTFSLRAIHVDHGIHPDSGSWAAHCRKTAQSYGIPIEISELKLAALPGESLEAQARHARYAWFAEQVKEAEILLTAHHLNDQAETFLLQLLRGSGLKGLASMAAKRRLGKGFLVRPLLHVDRALMDAYVNAYHLMWIDDPSNDAVRFRRNFLRQQIVPLLENASPGAVPCIARSANHCAQGQALLEEYLSAELEKAQGGQPHTLCLAYLRTLSCLKQKHLLRYWLQRNGISMLPSTKKLQAVLDQMLMAKPDAQPDVRWGQHAIRRFRNLLYVLPSSHAALSHPLLWDLNVPLCLSDGTIWAAKRVSGRGIAEEKLTQTIEVRFRQGGERCRPAGKQGSRPLKKWLQAYEVPTWLRHTLPLLYHEGNLVNVGDLFVCAGWQVVDPAVYGWVIEKVN